MSAYEKPSTWGLPESMVENLGKAMEQRPKANPLVNLMTLLTKSANEIANLESDPNDWPGWIVYLLEALEVEATSDRKEAGFESMLPILQLALERRIQRGRW